ncbi:MAG: Dam family site-specific DNA-(adenine-N6)-methyltransferase [Helicobacteraceae bacterium]|jgi:DNA adenine methylase|nr:Dam family site-specific DNA-(adenine-N6)-methyltransferase [Helicobacteraceae bacterium]
MNTFIWQNELKRSPFFYVGDKYKLLPQLKENFPQEIDRFIEPFCGGGSVFLNINANSYLLNDIDKNMIELHKFLFNHSNKTDIFWAEIKRAIKNYNLSATFIGKEVSASLKKEFPKTYFAQYNKKAYAQIKEDFNNNQNNCLLLYLLLIYGFNRMLRFNSDGKFNLPVGNVDFNRNVKKALDKYFYYTNNRNISFYNLDFEYFVKSVKPQQDDFAYFDPPYLIASSEYNKRWANGSETRLLNLLDNLNQNKIKFAVSNVILHKNKRNEIFNEWAQKYNIIKIKSNYISFNDNKEKNTIEVLVKNY